jgi:hypothetical protein
MEESYSWKELEAKFDRIAQTEKGLRLDFQWGSVPELYSLVCYNDITSYDQFIQLSFTAGKKLFDNFIGKKEFQEIFKNDQYHIIWYNALRLLSGKFIPKFIADQEKDGISLGAVCLGSISNVASVSAFICMNLVSIADKSTPKFKSSAEKKSANNQKIPKRIEKKIFQEANSACAFCKQNEIVMLDIHHIIRRKDGGPNEELNLILVCKKCHTDIEDGIITLTEVMRKKQELVKYKDSIKKEDKNIPIFQLNNNKIESSIIAKTVNIGKKGSPKMNHPFGSIGANLNMNNYIKYLIDKYYKYREADKSYGRFENFSYGEIHNSIFRKFKAKTYFVREERFTELYEYLYWRIDRTIQGKRNKAYGISNYPTFVEYMDSN